MRNDDLEQMEYIRKWKQQKEYKRRVTAYHWAVIKFHFRALLRCYFSRKEGAK